MKEFLRSLNPNLEHRLKHFVDRLGIKDHQSLSAFKSYSIGIREGILREGQLSVLERVAVNSFFWDSDSSQPMRRDNVNICSSRPPAPATDPSAPVKEFLRSLNPNLEYLLKHFDKLGIKDHRSLSVFKAYSTRARERFLREGQFNLLERFAVDNFFWDSE